MDNEVKKEYELAVLLDSEAAEKDMDKLLADLAIEILNKEPARLLQLAYPIKKHSSAALLVYQFVADPEAVISVEKALKFQNNVLRSLIITPPVAKTNDVTRKKPASNSESKQAGPEISSTEELAKTLEQLK